VSFTNSQSPAQYEHPTGDRRDELERIKLATWPVDEPEHVRADRISRALAAIAQLKRPSYDFDSQMWKHIAESPEVYDEE
jgi:hypothetical protein